MLFRLLESRKLKNIPNATYPNPKINLSWYNIPGIPYGARKFLYISGTWYVTTYRPPQNHGELHARQATGSLAQIVEERYSSLSYDHGLHRSDPPRSRCLRSLPKLIASDFCTIVWCFCIEKPFSLVLSMIR